MRVLPAIRNSPHLWSSLHHREGHLCSLGAALQHQVPLPGMERHRLQHLDLARHSVSKALQRGAVQQDIESREERTQCSETERSAADRTEDERGRGEGEIPEVHACGDVYRCHLPEPGRVLTAIPTGKFVCLLFLFITVGISKGV